jgi:hypothetical protein
MYHALKIVRHTGTTVTVHVAKGTPYRSIRAGVTIEFVTEPSRGTPRAIANASESFLFLSSMSAYQLSEDNELMGAGTYEYQRVTTS